MSVLACVNTRTKDCFDLQADQTQPQKGAEPDAEPSRVAFYCQQLKTCLPKLVQIVDWVGDGYYAKKEFFDKPATRLRTDTRLRHLYTRTRVAGQRVFMIAK